MAGEKLLCDNQQDNYVSFITNVIQSENYVLKRLFYKTACEWGHRLPMPDTTLLWWEIVMKEKSVLYILSLTIQLY